ncbi:MAG: MarR family transcriptional regulator [Planctomycetota bacterium]
MIGQWRRERPDLDPAGLGVVLRVLHLEGLLAERLKRTLATTDLAPFEYDVLSALRRAGPLSIKALCDAAQLTSGAMTHRLDRLEERGFVERGAHDYDRRMTMVRLSPTGRAAVDRIVGRRMDDANASLAALDEPERAELARLLRKWKSGLSAPTQP